MQAAVGTWEGFLEVLSTASQGGGHTYLLLLCGLGGAPDSQGDC